MTPLRTTLVAVAATAALLATGMASRAQDRGPYAADGPPDLEIRRAPYPLEGAVTPDEFWSDDYRSGDLFKSLIAPEQMNLTRSHRRLCRVHPEVCGY